jgi:hypothetical protein
LLLGQALVRGNLGVTDVKGGLALVEEAGEAGNARSVIVLADFYTYGIGVPQDPQRSLSLLTTAAVSGNASAARSLIALYRAGRGDDLPRNLNQAEALLHQYAPMMDAYDIAFEEAMLAGSRADDPDSYQKFVDQVDAAPAGALPRLVTTIRGQNQNAYTYLVQELLAKRGIYQGPLNGLMTGSTIRAINALCREGGQETACARGPLHPETAKFLAGFLE